MAAQIIDVVAGLVWRDGLLLITQRPAGAHLAGQWEFPGGKVEPREEPAAALARELREELGCEVRVGAVREQLTHAYPEKTVRLEFFDCTWVSGEPRNLGVADHRWIGRHELSEFDFPAADRALLDELAARFGPLDGL